MLGPLFIQFRVLDVFDILLVAFLLYVLYKLLKGTVAINIFIGIISLYFIWKLVDMLEMDLLSEILGQFIGVGVIALIVVFQPEIRKFLLLLGTSTFFKQSSKKFLFWNIKLTNPIKQNIDPIVNACQKMSKNSTGALIVIAKNDGLKNLSETGQIVDAKISGQLLLTIFFKNNPLHDGAVIIQNNRIDAARCILPVSSNTSINSDLGLRHRAAVGITEQFDSIAIVVSEQTGNIAYSKSGKLVTNCSPAELKNFLEEGLN